MFKRKIVVNKKARYYQIGDANKNVSTLWVVLHGYAMLSEFFIKKFKKLDDGNTLIIAPEGLNRFYIGESFQRVGASWMTKEERESDIEENINYLNALIENVFKEIGHENVQLNVLGFSQGGATACRWVFNSKIKVDNLILWAGDIPKDTLTQENKAKWKTIKTHLVMGKKDHLIPEEMKAMFVNLVSQYELDYKLTQYDGDHRIYPDVLVRLAETF